MRTKWTISQLRVQRQISCDHETLYILRRNNAIWLGPFLGLMIHSSFNICIQVSTISLNRFCTLFALQHVINSNVPSMCGFLLPYYDDHCRLMKVTFLISLRCMQSEFCLYYYTSENIIERKYIDWTTMITINRTESNFLFDFCERIAIDAIEHGVRCTMQNSPLTSSNTSVRNRWTGNNVNWQDRWMENTKLNNNSKATFVIIK